jgi:hypothetical protein
MPLDKPGKSASGGLSNDAIHVPTSTPLYLTPNGYRS